MKKRILTIFGISIVLLTLLLTGLYLFVSSQYFIKKYLLPTLSDATGSRITAENISISHFSSKITLNKFTVWFNRQCELKGESLSFDYDFWNFIGGEIKINNLVSDGAKLKVKIEDEDILFNISLKCDLNCNFSKEEISANTFNLVVRDDKNRTLAKLSLLEKLCFEWTGNKFNANGVSAPIVKLDIDNFDLSILENIAVGSCDIQFIKGRLNSKLYAFVEGENGDIKIKGDVELLNSGGMFNDKQFNNLDLRQKVDLKIVSFEDIFINNSRTMFSVNSKEAIEFKTNGKININKQSGAIRLEITKLFAGTLNDLPVSFIKNVLGIRELFLNGFVQFDYKKGGNEYILKSKLKGDNLSFYEVKDGPDIPLLSSNIEIYLIKGKNALTFKKFICNIDTPKGRLGNLAIDGKLYIDGIDRSQLKVYSEGIKLKELLDVFNSMAGVFNINLKDVNADVDFCLKNITYGPFITLSCDAAVKLDSGVFDADPIYVSMNRTSSATGKVVYDFAKLGKNHFNIAAKASDVDIYPLLKTYDSNAYTEAKGTIKSFSVELEGNGFSLRDLEDSLKGQLIAVINNFSIPDNSSRYDLIRLIFIPIEAIAQISSIFGNVNLPVFFNDTAKYSRDIFNRVRNLDLVYGNIYLVAKSGKVYLKHCVFKGDGNPVSRLKFNGFIGFDQNIDLNTEIKLIDFFTIPLHVSGTISNPKPDYFDSITFLEDEIFGSAGKDILGVLKFPETAIENSLDDSDALFQGLAP